MTTISSLWFMLLVEGLIATTLVSVVLVGLTIMREQKDRAATARLVQKIKKDGVRRRDETRKLMQYKFGFEDEVAKEIATQSSREENRFYQNIINCYLQRDAVGFENIYIEFEGMIDHYRSLEPPGCGGGGPVAEAVAVDESEEIRRLTIENKRLSDEVGVTMQTMSRMMDEYSSMFAGGSADEVDDDQTLEQPQGDESDADAKDMSEAEQTSAGTEEIVSDEPNEESSLMIDGMDDLSDLDQKE
ncbi:MAG: hypothetical protein GY814_08420 [Gammaproteobacteria bacterium]|nr:hypothetical protein [Gammaproteobacteria bacterium]